MPTKKLTDETTGVPILATSKTKTPPAPVYEPTSLEFPNMAGDGEPDTEGNDD
jgi:hypothetical protein